MRALFACVSESFYRFVGPRTAQFISLKCDLRVKAEGV